MNKLWQWRVQGPRLGGAVLGLVLLAAGWPAAGETLVVKGERASLSQNYRFVRVLPAGTLIEGTVDTRDARVVTLKLDGQTYIGRRDEFITAAEAMDAAAVRRLDADGKLATLDDLFTRDYNRVETLGLGVLHVQRDSALMFQVEDTTVQVTQDTATTGKTGAVTRTTTATATPTYHYDPVLSLGQSRRFAREWNDEIAKLNTELDKRWEQRRDWLTRREQFTAAEQELKARAQQFAKDAALPPGQAYLVTVPKVALYRDKKLMQWLPQGTAVWGQPHPLVGWLTVVVDPAGSFDAQVAGLATALEVSNDYHSTKIRAENSIRRLEEELRLLKNRQQAYTDLSTNLRIAAKNDRGYLIFRDLDKHLGYRDFYTVDAPERASIVANAGNARAMLRDWDKDQKDLAKDLEAHHAQITQAKKDVAMAENHYQAAVTALAKVLPPLPTLPPLPASAAPAPAGSTAPPPPPPQEAPH